MVAWIVLTMASIMCEVASLLAGAMGVTLVLATAAGAFETGFLDLFAVSGEFLRSLET